MRNPSLSGCGGRVGPTREQSTPPRLHPHPHFPRPACFLPFLLPLSLSFFLLLSGFVCLFALLWSAIFLHRFSKPYTIQAGCPPLSLPLSRHSQYAIICLPIVPQLTSVCFLWEPLIPSSSFGACSPAGILKIENLVRDESGCSGIHLPTPPPGLERNTSSPLANRTYPWAYSFPTIRDLAVRALPFGGGAGLPQTAGPRRWWRPWPFSNQV